MSKALERENKRLTEALHRANSQAEHFEREWYFRGDEIERLQALSDEMYATITATLMLAPHASGAYKLLDKAVKSLQPRWIRQNTDGGLQKTEDHM
jgi:hypothetical protein